MATNTTGSQLVSDVIPLVIAEMALPLAERYLVAYQFADKATMPKNSGITYQFTRYSRVNLPFAPLSEGVSPNNQSMTLSTATAIAQQWSNAITISDVAEITPKHDVFQQGVKLLGMNLGETYERNAYTAASGLMAGTNINYTNSKTSRYGLAQTDVVTTKDVNRAVGILQTVGAPQFEGPAMENVKEDAKTLKKAGPAHYVALVHPLVAQDLASDTTVSTAWSYSDVDRLYNSDLGQWRGVRFCASNMIPKWTGVAQGSGSDGGGSGSSFTTTNYYVILTASPALTSMEEKIYQVSAAISMTSGHNMTVTTPNVPGYTFNIYVGTTTSPTYLGLSAQGPTSGPLAGIATQLPANTAITLTGVSTYAQTPPAPVATGVTVFPTFVLGKGAYGAVELDSVKFFYLKDADKSDIANQLRVMSYKVFYGMVIKNQAFFIRIESGSNFSPNPDSNSGVMQGATY
jgi:N4-gp56 family major capsid protein